MNKLGTPKEYPRRSSRLLRRLLLWGVAVGATYGVGRLAGGYLIYREYVAKVSADLRADSDPMAGTAQPGPGAWEAMLGAEDKAGRERRAADLLATLDGAGLQAAFRDLRRLPWSARRDQLIGMLLERWGAVDPVQALAAVEGLLPREQTESEDRILTGWMTVDFPGAWGWLSGKIDVQTPRGEVQRRYLGLLGTVLEQQGAEQAMTVVGGMQDSLMQRLSVVRIAEHLARYTPEKIAWLDGLPGRTRSEALSGFAQGWAETDPRAMVEWAMTLGVEAPRALRIGMQEWGASGDIPAAREWFARQPAGPVRDGALGSFIPAVAGRDMGVALELLAQASPDMKRAFSVPSGPLMLLLARAPRAGFDLVMATAEPAVRLPALESAVQRMARMDARTTRGYVENHPGLTTDERSVLLRQIEGARVPGQP